jgi:hypothetical protein
LSIAFDHIQAITDQGRERQATITSEIFIVQAVAFGKPRRFISIIYGFISKFKSGLRGAWRFPG